MLGRDVLAPVVVDPVSSPDWLDLSNHRRSTLFHSPLWMKVLQDTYGFDFHAVVLQRDERPVAGVPWADVNDHRGRRSVTLPFSDFCDVIGDNPDEIRRVAEALLERRDSWSILGTADLLPDVDVPARIVADYKWHRIDLTQDAETLWRLLHRSPRGSVNRARRESVEIVVADSESQLREWFRLHFGLRKRKHHLLAQPYSFFKNIWDTLIVPGHGWLLLAMHDGRVVAGGIDVIWNKVLYSKFSASDPENDRLRANYLLRWTAMLIGRERGCEVYDFGRTGAGNHGLIEFKRSFGAEETDLRSVTYRPDDRWEEVARTAAQILDETTRLLVDPSVPDSITQEAGARLYRYFA